MFVNLFSMLDSASNLTLHLAIPANQNLPEGLEDFFGMPLVPTGHVLQLPAQAPGYSAIAVRNAVHDRGWAVIGSGWQPPRK